MRFIELQNKKYCLNCQYLYSEKDYHNEIKRRWCTRYPEWVEVEFSERLNWCRGYREGRPILKPKVKASEFTKYGFKPCKKITKQAECYYLCVARGRKVLFVSDIQFDMTDWDENDPRIHKRPNCRYRDGRTALDIIYELIKADMLKK